MSSLTKKTIKFDPNFNAFGVYNKKKCKGIVFNEENPFEIASIVKLIVVKVALKFEKDLDISYTMPVFYERGTTAYLIPNKQYTLRQLVEASLVPSACEASNAIAINIGKKKGGKNDRQCLEIFIQMMR